MLSQLYCRVVSAHLSILVEASQEVKCVIWEEAAVVECVGEHLCNGLHHVDNPTSQSSKVVLWTVQHRGTHRLVILVLIHYHPGLKHLQRKYTV